MQSLVTVIGNKIGRAMSSNGHRHQDRPCKVLRSNSKYYNGHFARSAVLSRYTLTGRLLAQFYRMKIFCTYQCPCVWPTLTETSAHVPGPHLQDPVPICLAHLYRKQFPSAWLTFTETSSHALGPLLQKPVLMRWPTSTETRAHACGPPLQKVCMWAPLQKPVPMRWPTSTEN